MRDPWAVAPRRGGGARAPETRRSTSPSAHAGRASTRRWLRKPRRGGGGRACAGGWADGCARPRSFSATSAVCPARRWRSPTAAAPRARPHRAAASRAGFQWTGNVAPPRLPEASGPSWMASCARSATRWRRASACVGRLGWTRSGTGATPGCSRSTPAARRAGAVRAWQLRGACPRGAAASSFPPPARRRRGVCNGEARAVCRRVTVRARTRLVAGGPGARYSARRRDDQRGAPVCTLISATADEPELAARGARLLSALPRRGAWPVADSLGPFTCAGCGLLCDDVIVERLADAVRLQPSVSPWRRVVLGPRRAAGGRAPAADDRRSAGRHRDGAHPRRRAAARGARAAGARLRRSATVEDARAAARSPTGWGRCRDRRRRPVAGCSGGAAARRLDRHPGRDPRPLAADRHLARGPRDHPSAAARARLGLGDRCRRAASRRQPHARGRRRPGHRHRRGAPTCACDGRPSATCEALTGLHVLQRKLSLARRPRAGVGRPAGAHRRCAPCRVRARRRPQRGREASGASSRCMISSERCHTTATSSR